MDTRYHRVKWGVNGTRVKTSHANWKKPLKWNREAGDAGERRKVFCASLADVFEDRAELIPWRKELFELIEKCPNLDWLLITKRPQNIAKMWTYTGFSENIWLGTSVAEQKDTEAINALVECQCLAKYLFVSLEPQISRVTLLPWMEPKPLISWCISGGESDQGSPARPFDLDWARQTAEECLRNGVAWFMKQIGSNPYDRGVTICTHFKDRHGADMSEWPEELRVRQFPNEVFSF